MLAQPAEDVASALAALGTALLEWKLDGARVQVHKAGDEVRVFTRSLQRGHGSPCPEVVEAVSALPAPSLILDGEAIALRADGAPASVPDHHAPLRPQARRRSACAASCRCRCSSSTACSPTARTLIDRPAARAASARSQQVVAARARDVPRSCTGDAGEGEAFYEDALARGHEGVMAKALDAPYEAGRRGARLAQGQARAHARPGGAGGRVGQRPAQGLALATCTSARATRQRRLRHARQDVQGHDRRDARVADARTAGARGRGATSGRSTCAPSWWSRSPSTTCRKAPHYPGGLALRFARVKGYRPDKRPEEADTIDTVRRIYEESLA